MHLKNNCGHFGWAAVAYICWEGGESSQCSLARCAIGLNDFVLLWVLRLHKKGHLENQFRKQRSLGVQCTTLYYNHHGQILDKNVALKLSKIDYYMTQAAPVSLQIIINLTNEYNNIEELKLWA